MQDGVPSAWDRASLACSSHPPLLLPSVSQALQCYSFQHVYFGPFDLSGMKFANISCPYGCSEAVLSLDTGERQGRGGEIKKEKGVQKRKGWGARTRVRAKGRGEGPGGGLEELCRRKGAG